MEFGWGYFLGLLWAILALWVMDARVKQIEQQAFERGHMVQCVGKTGYYWECEK